MMMMMMMMIIIIIIIGRNEKDLEKELTIVRAISKDIHMNFGLDKYARICLKGCRDQSKIRGASRK